jgi:hypothetical protein
MQIPHLELLALRRDLMGEAPYRMAENLRRILVGRPVFSNELGFHIPNTFARPIIDGPLARCKVIVESCLNATFQRELLLSATMFKTTISPLPCQK